METPLWPFARTLILSTSNMRVLSTLNGAPTPSHTHIHINMTVKYCIYCKCVLNRFCVNLPAQWDSITFSCNCLKGEKNVCWCSMCIHVSSCIRCLWLIYNWTYVSSSFGMSVCANFPKPVLTPYITAVKKTQKNNTQYIQVSAKRTVMFQPMDWREGGKKNIPLPSLIKPSITSLLFLTFSSASGVNWKENSKHQHLSPL